MGVEEEKICRVLMDFDLALWTEDLKRDDSKISQRMGMSSFMAYELLLLCFQTSYLSFMAKS